MKPAVARASKPAAKSAPKPAEVPAPPPAAPPAWIWHECVTSDVVGAKAFYTGLFGWTAQDVQMPTGPYTLFLKNGANVGGCMPIPTENGQPCCPPNWCSYVHVDDVDASANKAGDLGGKVVAGPMDVPGIGRFAVLLDPQGASFAIFRPSM
jgi:predicted enzyme related to lactoylglutathione lyase